MRLAGTTGTYVALSAFSAAVTGGIGIMLPFFPLWLAAQNLDDTGLAFIVGVPSLVRMFVNPPVGAFADRHGALASVLAVCGCATFLGFAMLYFASGFWGILACVLLVSAAQGPLLALTDSLIFAHIRTSMTLPGAGPLHYGSIRAWGSVAVLVLMLAGGHLLEQLGVQAIAPVLAGLALVTAFSAMLMAAARPQQHDADATADRDHRPMPHKFGVALVILAAALIQASHGLLYTFGTLEWQQQGFSGGFIGLAWALGVMAEIVFFLCADRIFERQRQAAVACLLAGALASMLRWTLMIWPLPAPLLLVVQLGHGISFGATHIGAVTLLAQITPVQHRAQAQAWLASAISFCIFAAMALCGPLHQQYGSKSYAAMVFIAVLGLVCAIASVNQQQRQAHH